MISKKKVDWVVNVGSLSIGAICALTGQCHLAVPVLAGATAYNGVDVVKDFLVKKS